MQFNLDESTVRVFETLYGRHSREIDRQVARYREGLYQFNSLFGETDGEIQIFSTPGRTEIGGNHTDHNLGRVLAGGVNLDTIAVARARDEKIIHCYSKGYEGAFIVDLDELKPIEAEEGTTNALIRGIAARFVELGYEIGGFDVYLDSEVLPGSGLSSSASIEVVLGTILSYLYNDGEVTPELLAKIGQYAENNFFGKPCGLMDQMACAIGGFITIDFEHLDNPVVEKIDFDIQSQGYNLVIVNTGGDHSDLTEDYAAIPREMKSIAQAMGGQVCREFTIEELIDNIPAFRSELGDRAILRGMHFFREDERVVRQVAALKAGDFSGFLRLVNESGSSSWRWLQNCFTTHSPGEQGITLALALTELFIDENEIDGGCRVHGGGFAGTIQAFLPIESTPRYTEMIERVFGSGAVTVLGIRQLGTVNINSMIER